MQGTKKLLLLAGAAVSTAALALPADSHAFPSACVVNLPTNAGTWQTWRDGSQGGATQYLGGSNFDDGHGVLSVDGVAYPELPNVDMACDVTTDEKVEYPARSLNGVFVTRTIEVIDGGVRRVDTFKNPNGVQKVIDIDYQLRVLGSQAITETESGNNEADSDDHWTVHENSGSSHPWLQWGEDADNVIDPTVLSLGADTDDWKWENPMPDATLQYENVVVGAGDTVRLIHLSGSGDSAAASKARAQNVAGAFKGLSLNVAREVINYGTDPDKDGVAKHLDACPSQVGNGANGCPQFVFVPPTGGGGGGGEQQPAPTPGTPAPTPTPTPGPAPAPKDTTAPKITLSGLSSKVKRSKLTGKGISAKLRCDERCTLRVKVQVKRRGAKKATTVQSPRPSSSGTLKLKVSKKSLRRLSRQRMTVLVVATDAAGNKRTLTKTVALR